MRQLLDAIGRRAYTPSMAKEFLSSPSAAARAFWRRLELARAPAPDPDEPSTAFDAEAFLTAYHAEPDPAVREAALAKLQAQDDETALQVLKELSIAVLRRTGNEHLIPPKMAKARAKRRP